jgi:hypothetical protein
MCSAKFCIDFTKVVKSNSLFMLDLPLMKNYVSVLAWALIICLSPACSEDFKVGAPYKNITIVTAVLDPADSAQYVKITRGFFDDTKNNIELARVADSLYHDTLIVLIGNDTLKKVSLKAEGIVKDTGAFVNDPAYAYKLPVGRPLSNTLTIINPKTGEVITSKATLLGNIVTPQFDPILGNLPFNLPTLYKAVITYGAHQMVVPLQKYY